MDILLRLVMVVCLVGILRSSERFRGMSRTVDESVLIALKKFMHAAEESGLPPEIVPLLLMLTMLVFMSLIVTTGGGRL